MQALGKDLQVNRGISLCEIIFLRSAFNVLPSIFLFFYLGKDTLLSVSRKDAPIVLLRCILSSLAFIVVTKTVKFVPLTIFQVLTKLDAFANALLAFVWLGEKLHYF